MSILLDVTSSLAGCLGNDSDDSKDSDDSESSSGGCDSAPWLFVMTGHNVTIDLEAEIDTNASNMNATFTIHNEEFIGSVVAYTEAVEGERGEMVTTNDHYGHLDAPSSITQRYSLFTRFMEQKWSNYWDKG